MIGIPEPRLSLAERVRRGSGATTISRPAPQYPVDAGRQIDTGGLSASGFGSSPIAQTGYGMTGETGGAPAQRITDGYQGAPRWSNGANWQGARLIQRINPVDWWRGGVKKEMEVGGP